MTVDEAMSSPTPAGRVLRTEGPRVLRTEGPNPLDNPFGTLPDTAAAMINHIARHIAWEFGHSDPHDLVNDAWLWIGAHPRQSAKWWYLADDGEIAFSYRQFRRDVTRCCATTARRDKAIALGYNPDDEYSYAIAMIKHYLPYVWHEDVVAAVHEYQEGANRPDPARGGDSVVAAIDVRSAYRNTVHAGSTWDRALFAVYAGGLTQREVAEEMQISPQRVSQILTAAIRELAKNLNGTEGMRRNEMPHHTLGDGPTARRAMSNAEALAMIG